MSIRELSDPLLTGLFSADSHVVEPVSVWDGVLPPTFFPREGTAAGRWAERGPGTDPEVRHLEMAEDGVIGEVLYPSRGLNLFGIRDVETHEAACHAYNAWLGAYCGADPERLLGIGMIPAYDTAHSVEEIRYCHDLGFRGIMLWQVPHPELPYRGSHYEPIWEEASRLGLPVSFHILTGFWRQYRVSVQGFDLPEEDKPGVSSPLYLYDVYQRAVNFKLQSVMDITLSLILTGAFDRHPDLRVVFVENEIGWVPYAATQFDAYYRKRIVDDNGDDVPRAAIERKPSAYFEDRIFATFFQDALSGPMFEYFGSDTFMWSNDYPHPNSTWPHSKEWILPTMGGLSPQVRSKVLRGNAERLYGPIPDLER